MRRSCTCSLRDCLWCNRSATVGLRYELCMVLGGRGLTPHNVSLPFISALVCIDCQCQKPPIFHLVMRSDLQTRSQPTTLLSTVPVEIELYLLAASATWTITRLSASSCEQGASPSMSRGCRKMTSFDLVIIYLPTQCQLCVLYPFAVTHNGRNTSWTYDSQKVPASACFSTYKTASPSNTKHQRCSHLTPLGHLLGIEQCSSWCPV